MKKFFTAIGWACLFLFLFLVVQTIVSMAAMVAILLSNPEILSGDPMAMTRDLTNAIYQYGTPIVGVSALILIPVLFLFKPSGQTRKEGYRLRWMGFYNLFSVIALAFGLYLLVNLALTWIPWPASWVTQHETYTGAVTGGSFFINLLCTVVLAPFMEELLFRGAIFGALKKGMPTVVAMILQAAFFGVMHMNPIQFIYAFVLGLCFGLVYERTKSIWAPFVLHVIINGLSVMITEVGTDRLNQWLAQPQINRAVLIGCAVMGVLGILGLILFNRRKQPTLVPLEPTGM